MTALLVASTNSSVLLLVASTSSSVRSDIWRDSSPNDSRQFIALPEILRKTHLFCEGFLNVCPEPVLTN
jgi:hypothetical protein